MLTVSGVAKIIKIIDNKDDKNGEKYASFSAVFKSDNGDEYVILKTFKSQAEYVLRNLGDSPRRVQIVGRLSVQKTEKEVTIIKKVRVGAKGNVHEIPFKTVEKDFVTTIMLSDIRFIDKKPNEILESEEISIIDEDMIIIEVE